MTTDSTQPQTDLGPAPADGQVQSQGHRRRRRRRKNKNAGPQPGAQPVAAQGQPAQSPTHTPPIPSLQAAPPPRAAHQAHQGQGRKKKKFFQKGSPNPAQSGNNASSHAHSHAPGNSQGGSQGKRKGKQKGPREFVGPMDHSYRAVNGNVADGPPSTIQITSNGHGGGYFADNYAPPTAAAVRHDAPTRIFCFIDDLFFQAKITETSKKLGIKVEFVKGDKESVAKMTDVAEADRPALVVFDLNNPTAKPLTLIPKIKTKLKKSTSIVGFLNHLQGDLKAKAVEAGCDTVMPRAAFSQNLPNLLRRYGTHQEDEDNFNQ